MVKVPNSDESRVLSFVPRTVTFGDGPHHGTYRELFTSGAATFDAATALELEPWAYRVHLR